jgi:hypothetical protein
MKNTIMATSLLVARYLGRGKQGKFKKYNSNLKID